MNSNLIEFLRFGSSIPGGYWGCCAGDIIQAFKSEPDTKASIQSVNGDSGYPQKIVRNGKSEDAFFGPTNLDIFLQRLRVGTFGTGDMPNHFFFIVLTESQCSSPMGKKWLKIMKEQGFEFVRTVNNSVWNVNNHIFMLVRNCGPNAVADQFTPPAAWTALPSNGKTELWELLGKGTNIAAKDLTKQYKDVDAPLFAKLPSKLLSEEEVRAAGAPVILAGLRSANPQELKETRDKRNATAKKEKSLREETKPMPVTGSKLTI